jgi:HEAT repeat protein
MHFIVGCAVILSVVSGESADAAASPTPPQSARGLVELFRNEPVFWRQLEIAKKMIAAGDPQLLGELEPWLGHDDRHVRANVALLFAAFNHRRGFETLAEILNDRSDRAIGQGIPGGKPTVSAQIATDRYYAVHVLGELKDPRGIDLLLPFLEDSQINYKIAWTLAAIGTDRAFDVLLLLLRDRAARTRVAAIEALEKAKAKQALPHLREMVNDNAWLYGDGNVTVADIAKRAIRTLEGLP